LPGHSVVFLKSLCPPSVVRVGNSFLRSVTNFFSAISWLGEGFPPSVAAHKTCNEFGACLANHCRIF
jgi:hypothetical protein